MHAGSDAELLEAGRRAVRERVELRVSRALVHEIKRWPSAQIVSTAFSSTLCTDESSSGAFWRTCEG